MKCALIRNGEVVVIQDLTEEEIHQEAYSYQAIIDISSANPVPEVGWLFNGRDIVAPYGFNTSRKITKLGMRNRFTPTEKVTLQAVASQTNQNGFMLQSYLADFAVATYIDLARPDTQAGIRFLEQAGLIGVGRANQILTAPITREEAYRE